MPRKSLPNCKDCGVKLTSENRGPSNGNLCNPCRSKRQSPPRWDDPEYVKNVERKAYLKGLAPDAPSKICARCGIDKPREDFTPSPNNAGGLKPYCKRCSADLALERVRADPEGKKRIDAKSRYGGVDIDAMWLAQEGLCASCGGPMQRFGRNSDSMAVDHDHSCCPSARTCGHCVRGLLHRSCNAMIGIAGEDPAVLEAGAAYVRRLTDASNNLTRQHVPVRAATGKYRKSGSSC